MARALLCAAALLAPSAALAETTQSFQVNARIVAGCAVSTDASGRWGAIALGTVPGVAGSTASGTLVSSAGAGIAVECTPQLTASLSADIGDHAASGERYLARNGGGAIRYQLYANGAATPWRSAAVPLTFTGGVTTIPIRAVATLAGPAAAGTYTDTVRVTLAW